VSLFVLISIGLIQIACLLQFTISQIAFIPPRLTESADERLLEESIERQREFTSKLYPTSADVPSFIVHSYGPCDVLQANGIEVTGDGFLELSTTFPIGSVEYTETSSICIVVSKHTIPIINYTSNQFARRVGIYHSLLMNDITSLWSEFIPNDFHCFLYLCNFVLFYRRTCITFNTTTSLTHSEVATKRL
jgi:hypothetical protein